MKEAFYYLNLNAEIQGSITKDNRECLSRELLVNCAGSINTALHHRSENKNGRLDFYLVYILSGGMVFSSGEKKKTLARGDIIVIEPKTDYMQSFVKNEQLNYLWVHFTGSGARSVLQELNINLFPAVNKTCEPNHLQTRFSRLFDCFLKNDSLRERDLSASLEKLLVEISRAITSYKKPRVSLSKSIQHINANYTSSLKIPDLARLEGMSMTRYNLHFKEQIGMPPTKYIIQLRISMAKELLCSSDTPLSQIASMCGYEDYNFFAKVFKSVVGCSPKKFRNDESK